MIEAVSILAAIQSVRQFSELESWLFGPASSFAPSDFVKSRTTIAKLELCQQILTNRLSFSAFWHFVRDFGIRDDYIHFMLFWIFALILIGLVATVGFNMGAVRAAISFVGLIISAFLAFPVGRLVAPILGMVGFKDPLTIWSLSPIIGFIILMIVVKSFAAAIFQKIDVYYKYKAGDLRMGMFERMNHRVGLSIGIANGCIYLILISMPIYVMSYATNQLQNDDSAPITTKTVNFLGAQIRTAGFDKISASIDPMPESYYDAIDIISLLYNNALLEGRVVRYPGFFTLGEKPEFQNLGADANFTKLTQEHRPFGEILDNPNIQTILTNPDLEQEIWKIAEPDLKDLLAFLKTEASAKYDAIPLLGRWSFDLRGSLGLLRRVNPAISRADMEAGSNFMFFSFSKVTLTAAPDKSVFVKNVGTIKPPQRQSGPVAKGPPPPPVVDYQNLKGTWDTTSSTKFKLSTGSLGNLDGAVEGDFLNLTGAQYPLRLARY